MGRLGRNSAASYSDIAPVRDALRLRETLSQVLPIGMEPTYDRAAVREMFSTMAATYGRMNLITSFGFSHLWRRECVRALGLRDGESVADLMCGMGEATTLLAKMGCDFEVLALDFCPEMCAKAERNLARCSPGRHEVVCADVFEHGYGGRFDRIVCTFGVKTLSGDQQERFADLLAQVLKGGGTAALVEISLPGSRLLRWPFAFYLKSVIPLLGKLLLGDPDCYRNLYRYTRAFAEDRGGFARRLQAAGLATRTRPLFFGCAELFEVRREP